MRNGLAGKSLMVASPFAQRRGFPARPDTAEVEAIEWLSLEEMQSLPNLLPSNHEFLAALSEGTVRLEE